MGLELKLSSKGNFREAVLEDDGANDITFTKGEDGSVFVSSYSEDMGSDVLYAHLSTESFAKIMAETLFELDIVSEVLDELETLIDKENGANENVEKYGA